VRSSTAVGGIEEIDPQFEGFLDDRSAVFFVQHPFVNQMFRVPEPHATEADARHIHSGVSELRVFHVIFLSFLLLLYADGTSFSVIDVAFSYIIEKLKDVGSLRDWSFALDIRGSEPLGS